MRLTSRAARLAMLLGGRFGSGVRGIDGTRVRSEQLSCRDNERNWHRMPQGPREPVLGEFKGKNTAVSTLQRVNTDY